MIHFEVKGNINNAGVSKGFERLFLCCFFFSKLNYKGHSSPQNQAQFCNAKNLFITYLLK